MSRRLTILALVSLVGAACGGAGGDSEGDSVFEGIGEAAESGTVGSGGGDSGPGSLEDPTPEASGALGPNTMRIGGTSWERALPTDGQCLAEEGRASVWGSATEEGVEIRVKLEENGTVTSQVSSNLMNWISGQKDGSELEVIVDAASGSVSGSGLFYNGHTNEWANGSFQFECEEDG